MTEPLPTFVEAFHLLPEVAQALSQGRPVVALESALITHGLPHPENVHIAREMEAIVRDAGATPATIALIEGRIHVGVSAEGLMALAQHPHPEKISLANLGIARARGYTGGTTVAATMWIAHQVGIQVFATGGIGGVHPGRIDVSADLPALATLPVAVVCAGMKSLLDVEATREWLETYGVPVIGLGTDEMPGFYTRSAGVPVDIRVETVAEAAYYIQEHWHLGLKGGVLVTVPLSEKDALTPDEVATALAQAEAEARAQDIQGKAVTPYILATLARLTGGRSVQANLQLLRQNARVAAQLAVLLAAEIERPRPDRPTFGS